MITPLKYKILIVDDEITQRLLLREALSHDEYDVCEAENGQQALSIFTQCSPDIVLMDVQMPVMDGYDACSRIRALSDLGSRVPILMVTGLEDVASIEHAYKVGATSFIAKPINWGLINHTVRYILRSAKAIENQIKSERMLKLVLNSIPIGVFWKDENLRFLGCNSQFLEDAGILHERRIIGKTSKELKDENIFVKSSTISEAHVLKTGQAKLNYEERWYDKNHTTRCLRSNLVPIEGDNQQIGLLGTYEDITKHKKAQEQIRFLAQYDSLTGLPNRALFMDRMLHAMKQSTRSERLLGIMFLDLDRFKTVNDSLGHYAGDALLKEVANRLKSCLRDGDTVARIGGDEFTILVERLTSVHACLQTAKNILNIFSEPFIINAQPLHISTSIGISIYPFVEGNIQDLLKSADIAMYEAKRLGRNRYCIYDMTYDSEATEKLLLQTDLHCALDDDQFELWYQPQYDAWGKKIIGVEALIRWFHPQRGLVSPIDFIPLLEDIGLMNEVGDWILHTACKEIQHFRDLNLNIERVAVNLSPVQFNSPRLLNLVKDALLESGLPAESLELEITEGSLMQNQDRSTEMLEDLKSLGIRVSIDDFGTGYSSLAYLKQFPIDALKIDQSFVKNLPHNEDDKGIVRAVIALSKSLNLRIISEGIESQESLDFLRKEGSDEMQGYYLSKPVNKIDLEILLKQNIF